MTKTMQAAIGVIGAAAAVLALAAPAAQADSESARHVSVLGHAEIDTHNPDSVFEISIHATGRGRSASGVVWMSHHNDARIGWMVARVDCVRVLGKVGVVTAVVSDAQDFAVAAPGDPIALTVRDNPTLDSMRFASRHQAQQCRIPRTPEQEITRGDFRVEH